MIKSDPNMYTVKEGTKPLKPVQIAIVNGYAAETKGTVFEQAGTSWVVDYRQVTDTAVKIMTRHLEKSGLTVVPQAQKTVTLNVKNVVSALRGMGYGGIRTTLELEAKYADGTSSLVPAENVSPAEAARVMDGAVLFAVTSMLNNERFVNYVNR